MRVLLDNCVNHRFAGHLVGWDVTHVRQLGWEELTNGKLLTAAQENGFGVLLTVDKSVRKQQNLVGRRISLITLDTYSILLEDLVPYVPKIEDSLRSLIASGLTGQDILISPS